MVVQKLQADEEYKKTLHSSREGINRTEEEILRIGHIIEPLIKQGLSPYAICQIHSEINISKKKLCTPILLTEHLKTLE